MGKVFETDINGELCVGKTPDLSCKSQSDGSVIYSCKICGMKPELTQCNMDMSYQYQCACGVSGARSKDESQALSYWNSIAFSANWNAPNKQDETR